MKFVSFITAVILTMGSAAAEPGSANLVEPLVINPSNKASPATVVGQAYRSAVNGDWYQARDCEDAIATFNNTKNAVMIYNSSIDFAARNKKINCSLAGIVPAQVLFIGYTYMNVCRKPGSPVDFGKSKNTLGMASMYAVPKHENNFVTAGSSTKLIPYPGSAEIVSAVRAGDVDLGWIGSGMAKKQGANLDCIYSTDPAAKNFIGKRLNLPIPNFQITYVVYTNTTDLNVLKNLKYAAQSRDFNKFLETSDTVANWNIKHKDLDDVYQYVNKMQSNWAD
jgi:hypothetical protein